MKLNELLERISGQLIGQSDTEIRDICVDTREAKPGDLFVCLKGENFDSHNATEQLAECGVDAIVVQRKPEAWSGSYILVENTLAALAEISNIFFGEPSQHLLMIGVTGTNGKTTLTYLLEHLLNQNGYKTAVIGTVNMRFAGEVLDNKLTTPISLDIQRQLADWRKKGATAVVMEVSSIAAVMHRVDAIEFDMGIFTNLTRDHLGFHGDMENYYLAKKRFFEMLVDSSKRKKAAIINTKSDWGQRLKSELSGHLEQIVEISEDLAAEKVKFSPSGLEFEFENQMVKLPMTGEYNLENAITAIAALKSLNSTLGIDFSSFAGVPGRLEIIKLGEQRFAYVDYAHTPDALENSVKALTQIANGQPVWTVFGCGGDRDTGKRPLMAAAAESGSDRTFVTSDNPRTENPQKIADDILAGFTNPCKVVVELDRPRAIARAVSELPAGGLLLVAGKGHETYQEVNGVRSPMDDKKLVEDAVNGSQFD